MRPLLRTFLVLLALLSSGVVQVAVAVGEDPCCAEEQGDACPECPPGVACACCPIRGALQAAALDVAPATSVGIAVAVAASEPSLGASATDIFHPPRA